MSGDSKDDPPQSVDSRDDPPQSGDSRDKPLPDPPTQSGDSGDDPPQNGDSRDDPQQTGDSRDDPSQSGDFRDNPPHTGYSEDDLHIYDSPAQSVHVFEFDYNGGSSNGEKDGFFHRKHRKHIFVIAILLILSVASIAYIAVPLVQEFVYKISGTAKYMSSQKGTYCPTDLTRSLPLEGPTAVPVWWIEPSVANPTDDNIAYHANHQPGDLFENGSTTVTYNFTGDEGLMYVCEFDVSVIVVDGRPPVVTNCTENLSLKAPAEDNKLKVTWTEPTAESSRPVSVFKPDPNQSPGSYFSIGTTAINYVFIDSIGLFSICSFSISVVDVTPPAIHQCPYEDLEFYVGSENALKSVLWIEPTATDNSGQVSLVRQTHRPGDFFFVGSTVVQYMYEDPTGNINMCSFFVKGKVSESNASRTQTLNSGLLIFSVLFTIFTSMQRTKFL